MAPSLWDVFPNNYINTTKIYYLSQQKCKNSKAKIHRNPRNENEKTYFLLP